MSRIHEYLPETLKDVIDLKLLNEDLDIELEQLDGYITGIGKEVIVKSASLYGIEKWEKALGITPKDGDSLETRRFRVNNLLTSKLPYTYRWLIKKLTQITGSPSGYTLNINQADYAITIVLSGLDTNMMIEVQKQLRNAIPSNMVLEIGGPPLVSADIKVGMALRIGTKYKIPSGYGDGSSDIPLGKNILPQNRYISSGVRGGITYTNNGDGTFDLVGTATQNITIQIIPDNAISLVAGQAYYLYCSEQYDIQDFNMSIPMKDGNSTKYLIANHTYTPVNTPTQERLQFYIKAGRSIDKRNIKLMLVKGSEAPEEYEPFIGL